MDHFPSISDPAEGHYQIPYLGDINALDGGDFATFPERRGLRLEGRGSKLADLCRSDGSKPSPSEKIGFLQTWLFFGLLRGVFMIINIPLNLHEFIKWGNPSSFITTSALPKYIKSWQEKEQSQSIPTQSQHLLETLTLLHKAGGVADSMLSWPCLNMDTDSEQLLIAESIAILGDGLMNASRRVWIHLRHEIDSLELARGKIWNRRRFSEPATLSLKRLRDQGWCKSSRMMMSRLVDTSGLWYAGMLKRPHMLKNHDSCSITECNAMCVDEVTYHTQHVRPDCSCAFIEVDAAQIARVVDDGKTPSVQFNRHSKTLSIANASDKYIVFSHVWAHGLGNPSLNALPICQLEKLQALANAVQNKRGILPGEKDTPTLSTHSQTLTSFWIDTLCVPVGEHLKESRKRAILRLAKVFSHAETVLILDAELQDVSISAVSMEKEIRMISCDWMRRVWTLSEALLPKPENLFWQFREAALDSKEIWTYHSDQAPHHVTYKDSAFDRRLPVLNKTPLSPEGLWADVLDILGAIRWRALSHIEDETICIAQILGFETDALLRHKDPTDRMRAFFTLWKTVPAQVLFMEGEKIPSPGHGWMPTTFVRGAHKSIIRVSRTQFTGYGPEGLFVTFPGLIFPSDRDPVALYCQVGFWNAIDENWYDVHDTGPIFESKLPVQQRWSYWKSALQSLRNPAFVLEFPSTNAGNFIVAVLVDIVRQEAGVVYAQFKARVCLFPCDRDTRFETQQITDRIEDWLEQRYNEILEECNGIDGSRGRKMTCPPRETFTPTPLDQRWCIG